MVRLRVSKRDVELKRTCCRSAVDAALDVRLLEGRLRLVEARAIVPGHGHREPASTATASANRSSRCVVATPRSTRPRLLRAAPSRCDSRGARASPAHRAPTPTGGDDRSQFRRCAGGQRSSKTEGLGGRRGRPSRGDPTISNHRRPSAFAAVARAVSHATRNAGRPRGRPDRWTVDISHFGDVAARTARRRPRAR